MTSGGEIGIARMRRPGTDIGIFEIEDSSCAGRSDAYLSFRRMKRLVWLLLAVFCIALVPVQSVDKAKTCSCCKVPGACGMPGCCPPPASLPAALSPAQSARAADLHACRKAEPVRRAGEKFYASFVEPAAARAALLASAEAAPAAHVPLFKAHCSFLI
jgi:hypothetical protein